MTDFQNLPVEVGTQILIDRFTKPQACIFQILVPDWRLCDCHKPAIERLLKLTRIDTYSTPSASDPGSISSNFNHSSTDHIHVPVMEDCRGLDTLGPFYHRELVRTWASQSTVVVNQVKPPVGFLFPDLPPLQHILRDEEAMALLPFDEKKTGQRYEIHHRFHRLSETDRISEAPGSYELPTFKNDAPTPAYELIRHLVLNTPLEILKLNPADVGTPPISRSYSPVVRDNVGRIGLALWNERKAFFELDWRKMKNLETLFLDLRGYSSNAASNLDMFDIAGLSHSLAGSNLKMLVIAGLRSYDMWPGVRPLTLEEVEEEDTDMDRTVDTPIMGGSCNDGVNWFGMFKNAVRPGGKLILADRQIDRYETPVWR
ncbi:hypothetical protein OQA88_1606 [Cercophora sp. LCS_1]